MARSAALRGRTYGCSLISSAQPPRCLTRNRDREPSLKCLYLTEESRYAVLAGLVAASRSPEYPNRDRFFVRDCLKSPCVVEQLLQRRLLDCTTTSVPLLRASSSTHVVAGAEAKCFASLDSNFIADCVWGNTTQTVFTAVLEN
jgi:hypothetical protein